MSHSFSAELQNTWKKAVLSQQKSGLSIAAWCKQNNVSDSKFYYWRDKLFSKCMDRESFVEIKDRKLAAKQSGVTIECHGFLIHLSSNFDPHVLMSCMDILKRI